ncbi:MAG: nitroreductase family protein, partial [Muribaculaceae bacterium]|nr:nitroreductase family protein [Muribaculaceae bacterium]
MIIKICNDAMKQDYFSKRVSVRNYSDKIIPESQLTSIIERAMRAPTCGNMQLYS